MSITLRPYRSGGWEVDITIRLDGRQSGLEPLEEVWRHSGHSRGRVRKYCEEGFSGAGY